MNESPHKALKIKETAQTAVHKRIGSLDREGLVRYFDNRQNALRYPVPSGDEQNLVRESSPEDKLHSN